MRTAANWQLWLLGSLALTSAVASAAETRPNPAEGLSVSSETDTRPAVLDNIYLNYFGIFHGPRLRDMSSTQTVDNNGNRSKFNNINFDSDVTAAYLVTPEIGVGFDIPFLAVPVLGKGLIMGDLGLKAFERKILQVGNLTVDGNLYIQAPTAQYSRDRGMDVGLKTTPSIRYRTPGSRLTLGSWTEFKEYFGVFRGQTFKMVLNPYINYKVANDFALNLGYEMEFHHDPGQQAGRLSNYQSDIQPGVVWNVSSKVLVNPFVAIFTSNKVGYDTMAAGAVISATAF